MEQFVGRGRELQALRRQVDMAATGAGGVVLVSGEPGVGKTATARQLAGSVSETVNVLFGACYEGEWQPALGPWIEAIGEHLQKLAPAVQQDLLGDAASSLTPMLAGSPAALPDAPDLPRLPAEEERLRLYDSISKLVIRISEQSPTLLVIDDLHWADIDTLLLLRYLTRTIDRYRILILGTYRPAEVESRQGSPLNEVLADLARGGGYQRVPLGGLGLDDVRRYLLSMAPLPESMIEAIHSETSGNPFYVRELYRHLAEEGRIAASGEAPFNKIDGIGVPDSVRRVLAKRLQRLSGEVVLILRSACAFTGGFDLPVLKTLTELPEEDLLDAIDEALRSGLLVTRNASKSTYDFAHALVRHTLMADLNPDRRARLHRRIAEAIEKLPDGEQRLEELAFQYHQSRTLDGGSRGITYALAAADRAAAAALLDRVVTLLRIARDLVPADDPMLGAEILRRLAVAEADALLFQSASRTAREAIASSKSAGLTAKAIADFVAEAARRLKDGGAPAELWEPFVRDALGSLGGGQDLRWARLQLLLDPVETVTTGRVNIGRWTGFDSEAVAIARARGTEEDFARTLEPYEWRTPAETREALARTATWTSSSAIIRALDAVIRDLVHRHDATAEAREVAYRMLNVSLQAGSIPGHVEALTELSFCHGVLGDFDLQAETLQRARDLVGRLGPRHRLQRVVESGAPGIRAFLLKDGEWDAIARAAGAFVSQPQTASTPLGFVFSSVAILSHAFGGFREEAIRLLEAVTPALLSVEATTYHKANAVDFCTWAIWELELSDFAADYLQLAREMLDSPLSAPLLGSHELAIARAFALLGKSEEAAVYFQKARERFQLGGRLPMLAITDIDEAVAGFRSGSGDAGRVQGLLEAGKVGSRGLGMVGWEKYADSVHVRTSKGRYVAGLTAREIEILRILATGATNKEIAAELFISVATVERHVANLYRKIGVRSRVEATAFALKQQLTQPG